MKIESSGVGFTSQHSSAKLATVEETLRVWVGQRPPDFEGSFPANIAPVFQTIATISAAGQQAASATQSKIEAHADTEIEDAARKANRDPKLQLLISIIEAMTGRKVRVFDPGDLEPIKTEHVQQAAEAAQTPQNKRQGWGVEYDRHETVSESEHTTFTAQGVVKTSDGKEIKFDLALEMKREFFQKSNVSIREGDAVKKDPLVINFNGTSAQLTDTKFNFDLGSDGKAESISFVGAGSGFLALDKNDNGIIDNGLELFGTKSGNGFADLSAYDGDGNGWIDEKDAIYSKLQVWSKDGSGKDTFGTLAGNGVGALYLGNVVTPFELKDGANVLHGQVRSTGIYLNENGGAGTLQQVDLVV